MAKQPSDFKKEKIDLGKYVDQDKQKEKRVKEKFALVAHLIRDAETHEIGAVAGVRIVADTPRRLANGLPPMELLNADVEAVMDDLMVLGLAHGSS